MKFSCRRTVASIPNGPSALAVKEAAWGLARYAAISQVFLLFPNRPYFYSAMARQAQDYNDM
jgi:hypothetical protein